MSTEEVVTGSSFFAKKCCSQSIRRKNERNSKKKMNVGKDRCKDSPYSPSEENTTSCDDMDDYLNRIKCVPIPNDQIIPDPKLNENCSVCGADFSIEMHEKPTPKKKMIMYIQGIPKFAQEMLEIIMTWIEKRRSGNAGDSQVRTKSRAKVNELRVAEELALGAMAGAVPMLSKKDRADHAERLSARESKRSSPFY